MRPLRLALATALLGGAAHAAPLTYDAALKLADQTAPSLQAKELDVRAATRAAVAAGRLPDPKLGVAVEGFPVSGPTAWNPARNDFSDVKLSVMQDVPSGAKREAARERARADIGAAQASRVVEAHNVRVGAALAWIDLYYAERKLAALDEIEQALKPLRDTAASQVASGAARPGQAVEPQLLTAALEDRRADLAAAVAKARAELVRWTGDAEAEVAGPPPALDVDAAGLRGGLARHPSLLAYDAMSRQAEADVDAARAEKHPDWSWEVGYQRRDPMFGDMVSIGATVSLPIFASRRQDPTIAARGETLSRVRIDREATRRALVAQLDADLADHTMHHDRLHRAGVLVPLAQKKADLERTSYAGGTANLSDVLQSAVALAEAQVDALDREADVARDAVRITLTYEPAQP